MQRAWALIPLAACAACSPDRLVDAARGALDRGAPTIFEVIDQQIWVLPFGVPDALRVAPDRVHLGLEVALDEDGVVTSAWRAAPAPDGTASAINYRCRRDARGAHRWVGEPDVWLAPLGVDLGAYPDLAPFRARFAISAPPGVMLRGSEAPSFTLDAAVRVGGGAALASTSWLHAEEEVAVPSVAAEDLPDVRLRKAASARVGMYADASFERPDFVLRLRTRGGAGPGEGSPCAPGDPDTRAPIEAEWWMVRVGVVAPPDAGP